MKLVSFRQNSSQTHVGVVREREIIDLTVWLPIKRSLPTFDMVDLIGMGRQGLDMVRMSLSAPAGELREAGALVAMQEDRLLAPIPRPRKNVFCLGRNYAEHGAESRRAWGEADSPPPPEHPAIFTKAPTSIIGPYDDIPYDANLTEKLDWECELAVIIGRTGKDIGRDEALGYVFGYMVLNDISARDIQKRHGGQFFKGKSLDGSCPSGPWIVTADELSDPGDLELWSRVNGVEKQHDRTSGMLLDVPGIIQSLSEGMTPEPGDIIATGTPAGVGFARTPPEFLHPGDVVECEIEKIGKIKNKVTSET